MFSASVEGVDDQGLIPESLSSEELESFIQAMYQSNETIKAENELLETYLANTDPTLVENMDSILDAATAAIHKAERTVQLGVMASVTTKPQESTATTPRSSGHSYTAGGSSAKVAAFTLSDKGPKIQPSQKMEIIQRELDLLKASFDEEKSSLEKSMFILHCKKSASSLRLREVELIRKNLEDSISKDWVDERTQKVAGERMITYFEHRIKSDLLQIKAFKTRRKNIRIQLDASNLKLRQLGEELKYVDHEKLLIEYKESQKHLANEMDTLTKLKEANTAYQVALNSQRSIRRKHNEELVKKELKIKNIDKKIKFLLQNESNTLNKFVNMQYKIDSYSQLLTKYAAPPKIIEYIQHKGEINDLKVAVQVATRKNRISRIKTPKTQSSGILKSVKQEKNKTANDFSIFTAPPSPKLN